MVATVKEVTQVDVTNQMSHVLNTKSMKISAKMSRLHATFPPIAQALPDQKMTGEEFISFLSKSDKFKKANGIQSKISIRVRLVEPMKIPN